HRLDHLRGGPHAPSVYADDDVVGPESNARGAAAEIAEDRAVARDGVELVRVGALQAVRVDAAQEVHCLGLESGVTRRERAFQEERAERFGDIWIGIRDVAIDVFSLRVASLGLELFAERS